MFRISFFSELQWIFFPSGAFHCIYIYIYIQKYRKRKKIEQISESFGQLERRQEINQPILDLEFLTECIKSLHSPYFSWPAYDLIILGDRLQVISCPNLGCYAWSSVRVERGMMWIIKIINHLYQENYILISGNKKDIIIIHDDLRIQ